MKYTWAERAARFRDTKTGKFVANELIYKWAQQSIETSPAFELAMDLAGEMSVGDWQLGMRDGIKREYIRQYLAGRGGREQMTQVDWGSIGGSLRDQYRYLDGFAKDVADGKLSKKQIVARSKMYFNSAREAKERGARRAEHDAGKDRVRWVRTPAESCEDCIRLSRSGWRKADPWPFVMGGVEIIPGSGHTACRTNCLCFLEYRHEQPTKLDLLTTGIGLS